MQAPYLSKYLTTYPSIPKKTPGLSDFSGSMILVNKVIRKLTISTSTIEYTKLLKVRVGQKVDFNI
jgi:hypothetical protein